MTSNFFSPRILLLFAALGAGILFWMLRSTPSDGGPGKESNHGQITAISTPNASGAGSKEAPAVATSIGSNEASASLQAQEQLRVLEDLLNTRNDNDPRMDRELLLLNEAAKELFRKKYRSLPAEKRNDRGTIVFLLGRNLTTTADMAFLNEVLNESPCLSLADCSRTETGGQNREHDEHQGGFAVSLAYPQLVALHSLESYLANKNSPLSEKARDLVSSAKHSPIPEVSRMAEAIEGKGAR